MIVVRYADDSIVGFEHRHEAEQFLADLKARLARFGLNLHPDKTRLIEFGRNAIANRRARGLGKPETFDFLGFKHHCATRRDGSGFVLGRKPMAKRMRTKLREIKEQLMATRHDGVDGQGKWLAQVLRGWMAYYAVPMSGSAISAFRHHMIERWHGALMRRSQRRRLTWTRMKTIADRYLPFPRILHPWPEKRFLVTIQGGSRKLRRPICAAVSQQRPGGASHFVGECDCHDFERSSHQQLREPGILQWILLGAPQHRMRADDENAPQIAITLLGDRPELLLAPG